MTFRKCPIDGYELAVTKMATEQDAISEWCCKGCGFISHFDTKYPGWVEYERRHKITEQDKQK